MESLLKSNTPKLMTTKVAHQLMVTAMVDNLGVLLARHNNVLWTKY